MSRFTHLEFGSGHEGEERQVPRNSVPASGVPLKGESQYLEEAHHAFSTGEFAAALRLYARVLEFNPKNTAAWSGQVRMLIELGEFKEAKLWADKALERFPDEPELLASKAVALARLGDVKGAMSYSDASLSVEGGSSYVWLARGDVQLAAEERRADYCFDRAVSMAPGEWMVRWLAARIHYYYKKVALAVRWIEEALALQNSAGVLWLLLGQCQVAMGLIGPAKESFRHAKELLADPAEADAGLRELYRLGFWERVGCHWRRWTAG